MKYILRDRKENILGWSFSGFAMRSMGPAAEEVQNVHPAKALGTEGDAREAAKTS